ncbi:sensor histidine kinase [Nonomuraea sp. SYSU D8015]|uniref:sensor histidine kinase n=1 Tax=Nonomuraea sp. SYSU D8015 TaxID=2593644 RepID=UPI001660D23D|nr:sensor histidine kinase [Nonomuraea sp. SYSU D8015]
METEHTHRRGRLRRPLAALSRLARLGDVPVVVMLAWAGWLAVPWSFSGLAQARAAAAAAAADAEPPPPLSAPAAEAPHGDPDRVTWGIPTAQAAPLRALRPAALRDAPFGEPRDRASGAALGSSGSGGTTPTRSGPGSTAADGPWTARTGLHGAGTDGAGPAVAGLRGTALDRGGAGLHGAPADGAVWAGPRAAGSLGGGLGAVTAPPAEDGRAAAEADAVALERARIAGEVHDAAGHGLAAIAMQAGIALVTLDDDPEQARASLRAIKETSTTALAQLRAALDGIDPPGGDLTSLIDGVRTAGLPVDVEPADLSVPAHLQGAVYRVVRESLTNVLRHAGPTRALVRVANDPCAFVLEVSDRGVGWTGAAEGRGLSGMRARVTQAGGHFAAGPREGGGFQVIARFPQVSA